MDANNKATKPAPIIEARDLTIGYGGANDPVAQNISFSLHAGEMMCLLGANGKGKSTLIRTLAGALAPIRGEVFLRGVEIGKLYNSDIARIIAIVNSDRTSAGGLTVRELVNLGRQPHTGYFGRLGAADRDAVSKAMTQVGISHKAHSLVASLSDGERQKVMIARALAQQTPAIMLDEPTSYLDVASRIGFLRLMSALAHDTGKAIILSTHDVADAIRIATHIAVFTHSGTFHCGSKHDIIGSSTLSTMFPPDSGVTFDPERESFVISED